MTGENEPAEQKAACLETVSMTPGTPEAPNHDRLGASALVGAGSFELPTSAL